MGTYERKTREIQKSLHRRARMRRAYFKMIGEDPKKKKNAEERAALDNGDAIDLSDVSGSDGESENTTKAAEATQKQPPKLTGRQLARKRRAEIYHKEKQREEDLQKARTRRLQHKNAFTKRTSRGQPKLGSQVGVLLDKIRSSQKEH